MAPTLILSRRTKRENFNLILRQMRQHKPHDSRSQTI